MSLIPPIYVEKYCFVYCGDRCDCVAGRRLNAGLADWIAASCDRSPKGGDPEGGSVEDESAVPVGQTPE